MLSRASSGLPTRSPGRSHSIEARSHSIESRSHSIEPRSHSLESRSHSLEARSHSLESRLHDIDPTSSLDRATKLPSLDLQGLTEPVFSASAWSDDAPANLSMADHPLLRGLLLELPDRGTLPQSDWLDRWFEAARSILELLYVQEAKRQI
ncbi:hypothetical protein [Actinoplanes awajinensis]